MTIDADDVRKIAHLARLTILEQEIPKYVTNLSKVLDLVEQMSKIDTQDVEPLAHPLDAYQRLRADAVTETDQRDHLMAQAPQTDKGHFLVPKVIE